MRVITGVAKGRHLKVPKPSTTRPMTDLVKGALFSMLAPLGIDGRRVLDLYAGSGSIGIEALSRGAAFADFVEQNAGVCAIIADNLAHTRLDRQGRVHRAKVSAYLARLAAAPPPPDERYDLVIMDPPYAAPDIVATLDAVVNSPALAPGAVIVVGHSVRVDLPEAVGPARRLHRRCHGDSCFSIYTMPSAGATAGAGEPSPAREGAQG
jgi:16S rRNA (guanine966-N2)-methyltransferase